MCQRTDDSCACSVAMGTSGEGLQTTEQSVRGEESAGPRQTWLPERPRHRIWLHPLDDIVIDVCGCRDVGEQRFERVLETKVVQ